LARLFSGVALPAALRHYGIAMWESIYHVETLLTDQWDRLSGNGRILAVAVGILALFYLARNSNSLVVNTVAAMVLLTLVAYLIMHYTGRV
jgi:hypothetical protein